MRSGIAALSLGLLVTAGCAGVPTPVAPQMPVVPSVGFLFERYQAPLQTNMKGDKLGSKMGKSRVHHIREPIFTQAPLFTWGDTPQDMAIAQAAKNGGIKTIRHIDYERFSILSTYVEITVMVYGD